MAKQETENNSETVNETEADNEKSSEEIETVEEVSDKEAEQAEKLSEGLDDQEALTQLGIYLTDITKELNAPATIKTSRDAGRIVFDLDTSKKGLLIGRHGKTLNALQYLAQVYIHRIAKDKLPIVVNVGNYRQKREDILESLAERTAEKVDRTGMPAFLEPMPAFERKHIHAVLSKKVTLLLILKETSLIVT